MRALRKVAPGAGLEWTNVEEPGCGPWDVKVRVLRAGICGDGAHRFSPELLGEVPRVAGLG